MFLQFGRTVHALIFVIIVIGIVLEEACKHFIVFYDKKNLKTYSTAVVWGINIKQKFV